MHNVESGLLTRTGPEYVPIAGRCVGTFQSADFWGLGSECKRG